MGFSKLVQSALDLADDFAPLLAGTPVGVAIKVGERILTLIDSVRETANEDETGALNARREVLEPQVMAHLDRTIKSLG